MNQIYSNNQMVSIVMPVYNVEEYIMNSVESVLAQSYKNWELIIVNDGSTDSSYEIAKSYSSKDSRIKVFTKPNGGLSDARNFGLLQTHGEYVHFLDSDDYISTNFYEDLLIKFDTHCDYLVFGYTVDYYNTKQELVRRTHFTPKSEYPENIPSDTFVNSYRNYLDFAWNKLYKRKFLVDNNLFFEKGLKLIEDAEFFLSVLKVSNSFRFVSVNGYFYCQRNRITLSKELHNATVELCERRLSIVREQMQYLKISDNSIEHYIGSLSFLMFKHIFSCLKGNESSYIDLILKKSLNSLILRNHALTYKPENLKDKLIRLCIFNKLSLLIKLIYT